MSALLTAHTHTPRGCALIVNTVQCPLLVLMLCDEVVKSGGKISEL